MESKNPVLKWKDYLIVALRSFFLQSAFNYGNYQGVGYANILMPALKKIYANNEKELKQSAIENIEFFNSNPQTLPFITSIHLALLDNGESAENARSIKMALMGPLSGIGDSFFQFGLAPLFSSIGAGLAAEGLIIGPILFFLGINISLITTKVVTGYYGYKLGTDYIDSLSEKMASISRMAAIVGITVVSGLAVSFVKINIPLKYTATLPDGSVNEIAFQTILDKITPNLLPALFTLYIFYLVRNKKWNVYQLLGLTVAIGMIGSVFGIIA
ncbi:PTS system mannose/fructose/sorbose family transporter subunit IID [Romboutsia lituseburensis]|uniref:PTS system mannose/fructose/sorbose family transporter subunit IID n=1 Tax=Romboutsia lituseburensis TaxID=1537 RepID=UPI00215B552E|nr:PTS system mannose/fructose/sorbose family transporter subunit IID [Romboutsia lituseburensis]MCR8744823.1 PTS system mannose/fructose/sorbose family transporter subunit IID [Romboutsia lituseburensis]